jgi:thiol-disulfide isomerase/thioredoxin
MIIIGNLEKRSTVLLAAVALASALGCDREAGPAAARKHASATASRETAPSSTVDDARDRTAKRAGGEVLGDERAEARASAGAAALTPVTGAQLLAAIRASGKRGTLVNAWASWCGPCRREVPMLQALSDNLKPQGVEVVLVSVDEPKDEPKAESFLKDNRITLKSYLVQGSIADFKEAINPRWPGMLPASFLFDRGAALVHFWGGEAFETEIVPVVESFLAGRAVEPETRYGLAPGKVEP